MKGNLLKIKNKLFGKILVFFVMIVLIPTVLIGIAASFISLKIMVDKAVLSYSTTVSNLEVMLENELFETKMTAYYMYLDFDLKEAITKFNDNLDESIKAESVIREKFNNYKISSNFSNVNAVKVYGFNGFNMSFGEKMELDNIDDVSIVNSEWYCKSLQNPDEFIWTGLQNDFIKIGEEKSISIFRVIKDRSYTKDIGMLYVNLDARIFSSMADKFSFSEKSQIYIVDNNNITVSDLETPKEIIELVKDKEEKSKKNYSCIVNGKNSEKYFLKFISDYNWKVIGVLPIDEVSKSSLELFVYAGVALLIILISSSIIWFFVLAKIFEPVNKLTLATKAIRKGDFSIQVNHSSNDELGILTNNFNYMVRKINELIQEVLDENNRKKDAEYRALQAQINPHFLYNTLNSIRWMAIIQKADNIKKVVDALGGLLRNSTSKMDQFITVKEEMDNLKDYIYIQKIAYNNKFQVEYDVSKDIEKYKCLKFILNPLVENAIFHGILPKESCGTIWISICKADNYLEFLVKDDGVGMSQEEIEKLLTKESESVKKLNGIGINSVFERLQMAYSRKAVFLIESKEDVYTSITIKIPLQDF